MAATRAQINGAINNGVAWLVTQQNSSSGYWQDSTGNIRGATGFALVKLEERAFELGYASPFDPCYPYEPNVEKGLAYLFSQLSIISISTQPHGNPDTDGDGYGVYINSGNTTTYETGIAMMAIAASRAPDRVINASSSPVNGWTYKKVLQNMVDFMAFGQCDSGSGRGGWLYSYYDNTGGTSDNSNSGYAVSGLGYAASPRYGFNCVIPQFVKDELKIWIDYIQTDCNCSDDGGSGYGGPGAANILRTGNLVFEMTLAGISPQDLNFQRALAYLDRNWNGTSGSGWVNNCQAMYSTSNGLSYSNINDVNQRDWYADFADALVSTQQSAGYWSGSPFGGNVLGTEWALLTLSKAPLLTLIKTDDVNDGDCVGPGNEITYTISYGNPVTDPCDLGYVGTVNDVNIIDYLPVEVEPNNPSDPNYDILSHAYTWHIGTLEPGDANCVTLTVEVNHPVPGSTIRNTCEIKSGEQILRIAYEDTAVCLYPIYVDVNATGGNNGLSWADAYKYLQDALAAAGPHCEIRVAQGTYRPDEDATHPNGNNNRYATFYLIDGVLIKGGYAGFGKPDPNARNIKQYETILSGDLKGNDSQIDNPPDLMNDPCRAENSYNVVRTVGSTDETAVLDGFTITGGNANANSYVTGDACSCGGGMYNYYGSPTVTNCTFSQNSAYSDGGGMYNYGSSPTVTNCLFKNNWADVQGGGIYNFTSGSPVITNCTFIGNMAAESQGGICDGDVQQMVTNCILWGNEPDQINGPATYSDIQGGYPGVGNIDADPMFAVDGYHLTLCSPCIDAGDPNYVAGPGETDIDGEPRIIDGDCDGKARVDMGVDEYYLADCNVLLRAHCPSPACRATDVPQDVNLSWKPGVDANKHDVYFGNDFNDVANANRSNPLGVLVSIGQNSNSCDPCTGLLEFDTTYYWRIDEVNGSTIWQGDVWHFRTVSDYNVVENFDEYNGQLASVLRKVWKDGFTNGNGTDSEVWPAQDPNRGGGSSWSMGYEFYNTYDPYYSEARAAVATARPNGLGENPNWLGMGAKALVLWFYGQAGNDANHPMYVTLTDSGNVSATVNYAGDMNDIRAASWHEWNIALTNFTGVNLANVKTITIGIGDGTPAASDGTVYFDDIRLYPRRCRPDLVAGDLDGDCAVDYRDLKIMTDNWLGMGCCEDLYKDDKVNFEDFAILANSWLEEGLWP